MHLPATLLELVAWLGPTIAIPVWALVALAVLAVAASGMLIARARRSERAPPPPPELPGAAEIFGIAWRWTHRNGEIRGLTPYCPVCDRAVRPTPESRHGYLQLVSFQCECRKWRTRSFQCSQEEFLARVSDAAREHIAGAATTRS